MLGSLLQNGMAQNHLGEGFGRGIQGGMDQMWRTNQANQNASLLRGRGGMGGGGQSQWAGWQPPPIGTRAYQDYQRDRNAQQEIDNNFQRTQRQLDRDADYQNRRQENTDYAYQYNNNRAFGLLGGLFGGQPGGNPWGGMFGLPTQFNTNYGAYGQYQAPVQPFNMSQPNY